MIDPFYYNFRASDYNPSDKEKNIRTYEDRMFAILCSSFGIDGLPDTIPEHWMKKVLLNSGFSIAQPVTADDFADVSNTKEAGVYIFEAAFGGILDIKGMPTHAIITDPNLRRSFQSKIGEECVLIKANSALSPARLMCERYARLLVENDISLFMADVNLRALNVFASADDRTRESAEMFMKKLVDGDMKAIVDSDFFGSIKLLPFLNAGANQIMTNLIEYHQYLRAGFFNDFGLSANYNMKREAINTEEAQLDSDSLLPYMDDMIDSINEGLDEMNTKFGTNAHAYLKSAWEDRRKATDQIDQESKAEKNKEEGVNTGEGQGIVTE